MFLPSLCSSYSLLREPRCTLGIGHPRRRVLPHVLTDSLLSSCSKSFLCIATLGLCLIVSAPLPRAFGRPFLPTTEVAERPFQFLSVLAFSSGVTTPDAPTDCLFPVRMIDDQEALDDQAGVEIKLFLKDFP